MELHPDLFGGETVIPRRQLIEDRAHAAAPGSGPEGETCEFCHNLDYNETRSGRRYYKCGLVSWTFGAATDIRLGDAACRFWATACQSGLAAVQTFEQIIGAR
jgi:hypothetical protein